MDTVLYHLVNDTLLSSTGVFNKVIVTYKSNNDFFTTSNPFWSVILLFIASAMTFLFGWVQRNKDSITEAKKILLNKRIEKHAELSSLFALARQTTNLSQGSATTFPQIFSSYEKFNNWFDKILTFASENEIYLSTKTMERICFLSNFRRVLDRIFNEACNKDEAAFKVFALNNNEELNRIFKKCFETCASFYENDLTLNYKYYRLQKADIEAIKTEINSFKMFK